MINNNVKQKFLTFLESQGWDTDTAIEYINELDYKGFDSKTAADLIGRRAGFTYAPGTGAPDISQVNTLNQITNEGGGSPTKQAVEDAAKGGTPGIFAKLKGGTMKKDFHLPNLRQGIGGANLGYSLGPTYYANDLQRYLTPDEVKRFKALGTIDGIDKSQVIKSGGGLKLGGYNVGTLWTGGQALMNTVRGFQNADNLNKAYEQGSDLKDSILSTAASTPNVSSYLTADEQKMLNQLKRGNYYEDNWGSDISDWGGVLGGGVKGAIAGLPGGAWGALLGGIGGAINGGLSSATKKKDANNAKLDALYNTLNYARNDYNSMKRPNFSGLGIQQRYRNAYM